MKHEWKKAEKGIYLPKTKPELIDLPSFKYYTIEGAGNPNDDFFGAYIQVLYALSYAIKMSPKKKAEPAGYFDYTVYPLEGIWDLSPEGIKNYNGKINKEHLVFKLMIRQPDFVDNQYALHMLATIQKEKPNNLFEKVKFEEISDGLCVQMLHIGSYDSEPESFRQMQDFATRQNYARKYMWHREIYLSDARKVAPENLKTVLRFVVEKQAV
jgi:hypothetical protein